MFETFWQRVVRSDRQHVSAQMDQIEDLLRGNGQSMDLHQIVKHVGHRGKVMHALKYLCKDGLITSSQPWNILAVSTGAIKFSYNTQQKRTKSKRRRK